MLRFITGIFLIIGSVVGGGIIAIPIASANFGFYITLFLILLSWGIMTYTGLLILNLSLQCAKRYNSYYSIVGKFLGFKVQAVTTVCFLLLLYFTLSSYISGCASLILGYVPRMQSHFPWWSICLGFVCFMGTFISLGRKLVVNANVLFVSLKLLLLFLVIFISFPHLNFQQSLALPVLSDSGLFSLGLIVINAFGFHFIVPSMVTYYGVEKSGNFKTMLISSTSLVCLLYTLWLLAIYSVIPETGAYGLKAIYASQNQLYAFNRSLIHFLGQTHVASIMAIFQVVSIFGSFLCVSLGVMDYIADMLKSEKRVLIGLLTFTPPLLLTLLSQNMYLIAMALSGYMAIVLEIIIPIWASRKMCQSAFDAQAVQASA